VGPALVGLLAAELATGLLVGSELGGAVWAILGVTDIVDQYVVVLARKERNSRKVLTMSHHIECSDSP